jgi:hypothetical protein
MNAAKSFVLTSAPPLSTSLMDVSAEGDGSLLKQALVEAVGEALPAGDGGGGTLGAGAGQQQQQQQAEARLPSSSLPEDGGGGGGAAAVRAGQGDRVTVHYRGRLRGDSGAELAWALLPLPGGKEAGTGAPAATATAAAAQARSQAAEQTTGPQYFDDSWARGAPLTFKMGFDPGALRRGEPAQWRVGVDANNDMPPVNHDGGDGGNDEE